MTPLTNYADSEYWSSVCIVDFEQVFAIFVHVPWIRQNDLPSNNWYSRINEKDVRVTP